MHDRFGLLPLPVPPRAKGPAGDPALEVLGAFLAAVLKVDVGKAWEPLAPGRPIVRGVFPHSVVKRRFVKEDLPHLFVFRSGNGRSERYTIDTYRRTQTVLVQWVFPPALNEHQTDRDPVVNAIGAAMERALYRARHPAWVAPADLAAPEGLVLPTVAPTQPGIWSGAALTGPLAGKVIQAARAVTISTAPAKGAYAVGAPITVVGRDATGHVCTDSVSLTSADGGELVRTFWHFSQVSEVRMPAMPSAAGSFSVGYAASPEATLGSLVMRHAGFSQLEVQRPAEVKPLLIAIKNPETRINDAPLPFEMVELALDVSELLREEPALHYQPLGASLGWEVRVAGVG
jgi:hypothetical protein